MFKRKLARWIAAVIGVIGLAVVWKYGETYYRLSGSDHGFESFTGVALPTGVNAIAHGSEMNDNLFHTTHYWELSGPQGSLRSLTGAFGLERSDEDARWMLPDMQEMFGAATTRADVVEGYEGSLDGGRDRWLILFKDEKGAVFVY